MTSVRGAVTKVSNSIAGYVYPRNYSATERHSHDEQSGTINTKRIKLEADADSVDTAVTLEQRRATDPQSSLKTNLVWVEESTRAAHWHQVALLVQALKDIEHRLQERHLEAKASSSISLSGKECCHQCGCSLSIHRQTFLQTAAIIEHIYSQTFLARLKEISKQPHSKMDYATDPDEYLAISAAKLFLDDLPEDTVSSLAEAGVMPRVVKGVSADLGAIKDQKPMPGLVQRAGFVGKMMKFFRGRDSFGFDSSAQTMPGSFPDARIKESVCEEDSLSQTKSEERGRRTNTTKPFMPVTQTDTYNYIREHLAGMEIKGRSLQNKTPAGTMPFSKVNTGLIPKKERQSLALKRLQRSRGLKKVQFLTSASRSLPPPAKPAGFLYKIFGSRNDNPLSSSLRYAQDNSVSGNIQTGGSPDSRKCGKPSEKLSKDLETDNTAGGSDEEDTMTRCRLKLVQHLNESLDGHKTNNPPRGDESTLIPASPLSPPTLAGLRISDDKEGELDDLSAALQLMLDEDEAQRKAEEARKAKEADEEKLRKTGGLRVPRKRLVTPLSANWSQRVQDTVRAQPHQVLSVTAESVELRRHDFLKVVPETEWLNDEIVNGSLLWLDRYINEAAGAVDIRSTKRVCLAMNSFFYKRLEDNGVHNTERALRRFGVTKANFLNLETILMPICKSNHWTLLVIRPQKRTISHMDSLNPRGSPIHTKRALEWIKALLGDDFRESEWRTVRHDAPVQDNGYDCGVFTITNGICLALGLNAIDAYSNDELPLQRLRIAAMLLNKGFKGDFDLSDL
ncbi:ulp1 protease family protein [Colletotrichum truncatum]|uniref:Ulp1 protease family protein n=1 Tax=Colletotrichum truncatum TaxID=5467 RepID=A0ACC3Z9N8_COLTU|nr:ulp1 protease family protein [Colletotrichum truncatum]KAF6795965.1 ulp1 protease family protein [Colletotrichum truncatum]